MTAQRKFQENTGFKQDPILALRHAASNLFICLSTNHLHLRLYLHASSKFSGEHCQTCIKEQTMKNTYAFNTTVKTVMSATLLLGTLGFAQMSLAGDLGDRIDRRLDNKGDRINDRLDRRAEIAEDRGRYGAANRLDRRGDRIENRLDRRGDRIDRRLACRADSHCGNDY